MMGVPVRSVFISFLSLIVLRPSNGQSIVQDVVFVVDESGTVGGAPNYETMIDFIINDLVDPTGGVIPSSPSVRVGALAYATSIDVIYELDSIQNDGRVALIDALTDERSDWSRGLNRAKSALEAARDMLMAAENQDGRARTIVYFQVGYPTPSRTEDPCSDPGFVASMSGIEIVVVQIQPYTTDTFPLLPCFVGADESNFIWLPNFGGLEGSVATPLSDFFVEVEPQLPFGYNAPTLAAPSLTLYISHPAFTIFPADPDDSTSNNGDRSVFNNVPFHSDIHDPDNSIVGYQNGVCTTMAIGPPNTAQSVCTWYITFVDDPTNTVLFVSSRVMVPPGDGVVVIDADPGATVHGDGAITGGSGALLGVGGYVKARRYVDTDGPLWQYDFFFVSP